MGLAYVELWLIYYSIQLNLIHTAPLTVGINSDKAALY